MGSFEIDFSMQMKMMVGTSREALLQWNRSSRLSERDFHNHPCITLLVHWLATLNFSSAPTGLVFPGVLLSFIIIAEVCALNCGRICRVAPVSEMISLLVPHESASIILWSCYIFYLPASLIFTFSFLGQELWELQLRVLMKVRIVFGVQIKWNFGATTHLSIDCLPVVDVKKLPSE